HDGATRWCVASLVFEWVPAIGRLLLFFFSSRRRHTRLQGDWSSDVCSSDLGRSITNRRATLPTHARARARAVDELLTQSPSAMRSEERRVGKECAFPWGWHGWKEKRGLA